MGNHRFRLSDMIPNAWFYKLKGMGKKSGRNQNNNNSCKKKHQNQNQPTSCSSSYSSTSASAKTTTTQRKSYYFTRDLNCPPPHHISPEPPRKSSNKRRTTAKRSSRTATTACSCRASMESVWTKPDSTPEKYPDSPLDSTSYSSEQDELHEFDLPPIITKPNNKFDESINNLRIKGESNQNQNHGYRSLSVKIVKNSDNIVTTSREKQRTCSVRRFSGNSPGLKLRTNSPRIGSRKIQGRRSTSIVAKSFAVVKSSNDPQRDFRESMVEMIVENNIRASKDLENLLACYLSLNANEYHDLIIKVFKQIWFDITDVRLK